MRFIRNDQWFMKFDLTTLVTSTIKLDRQIDSDNYMT